MYGDVKIEWAIVENELRHVSDFADLEPKNRPEARCQECENPLIFKCGDEKTHHFAHKFGDDECSGGEGILHQKVKIRTEAALKQTNQITIVKRCFACHSISGADMVISYDDVQLEYTYAGRMKADVGLLKGGIFCCGIEIFVSHRCSPSKISFHQRAGIPCVEINAENVAGWSPGKTLIPSSIYGVDRFICIMCEMRKQNYKPAYSKKVDLKRLPESNESGKRFELSKVEQKTIAWQSIFCQRNSRVERKITLEIIELTKGNKSERSLRFYEGASAYQILCKVSAPYTNEQKTLFNQKYNDFIKHLESDGYDVKPGQWR